MSHLLRTGSAMEGRAAHPNGVWEVVGILAAVIPCGILVGLYLATSDAMFLVVFAIFAVAAAGIVYFRRPRRPSWGRRRRQPGGAAENTAGYAARREADNGPADYLRAARTALSRTFTTRVLKLLGMVAWLVAWVVLAALYARVVETPNIPGLMMLVAIGGLSPFVIYFGLESGVKGLSRRLNDDE